MRRRIGRRRRTRGGDGTVRRVRFDEAMTVNVLSGPPGGRPVRAGRGRAGRASARTARSPPTAASTSSAQCSRPPSRPATDSRSRPRAAAATALGKRNGPGAGRNNALSAPTLPRAYYRSQASCVTSSRSQVGVRRCRHRHVVEFDHTTQGREERDVRGIDTGCDPHHRIAWSEAGRIDDVPGSVETCLGHDVEIHRHESRGIHRDDSGRDVVRTQQRGGQVGEVPAHPFACEQRLDRTVDRARRTSHVVDVDARPNWTPRRAGRHRRARRTRLAPAGRGDRTRNSGSAGRTERHRERLPSPARRGTQHGRLVVDEQQAAADVLEEAQMHRVDVARDRDAVETHAAVARPDGTYPSAMRDREHEVRLLGDRHFEVGRDGASGRRARCACPVIESQPRSCKLAGRRDTPIRVHRGTDAAMHEVELFDDVRREDERVQIGLADRTGHRIERAA